MYDFKHINLHSRAACATDNIRKELIYSLKCCVVTFHPLSLFKAIITQYINLQSD
jgi:hypothetical protein